MREFFPDNRVEYFVSYYDYYQPEAYIPSSDTYIEKDSSINDEIDRLRHSATAALLTRRDVIVVASVSCIYGMGNPEEYKGQLLELHTGVDYDKRAILRRLVDLQYDRNDIDARPRQVPCPRRHHRDPSRVRGVGAAGRDVRRHGRPNHRDRHDHRRARCASSPRRWCSPPPTTSRATNAWPSAMGRIEIELQQRLAEFEEQGKLLEAQRLRMRTQYDLEMMAEVGYCNGIENYSMHIDGRDVRRAAVHPPRLLPRRLLAGHRREPRRGAAAPRSVRRRPEPQGRPGRSRLPPPVGARQPPAPRSTRCSSASTSACSSRPRREPTRCACRRRSSNRSFGPRASSTPKSSSSPPRVRSTT